MYPNGLNFNHFLKNTWFARYGVSYTTSSFFFLRSQPLNENLFWDQLAVAVGS